MLAGIVESADVVRVGRTQGAGLIRLIASSSATNGLLIDCVPEFCRARPQIQLQMREAEGDDLLLGMARSEVDIAVCRRPAVLPQGWIFTEVASDRLAVICAPGHRLAKRRRVHWVDLQHERWLQAPAGSLAREALDAISTRFATGLQSHPVVTRGLTLTVHLLRHEGLLGFVPHSFVRHLLVSGELVHLPLAEVPSLSPLGTLVPDTDLRPAIDALVTFLHTYRLDPDIRSER